jgi:hypothetical protein
VKRLTTCEGEDGRAKEKVFETSPFATEAGTFFSSLRSTELSTDSKLETSKTVTPLRNPVTLCNSSQILIFCGFYRIVYTMAKITLS